MDGNSRDDDWKRKYRRKSWAVDRKTSSNNCDLRCTNWRDREQNRYVEDKERETDDAEHEERRIQRRLEEERRFLEMQMEMKKKEERGKEEKKKKVY